MHGRLVGDNFARRVEAVPAPTVRTSELAGLMVYGRDGGIAKEADDDALLSEYGWHSVSV